MNINPLQFANAGLGFLTGNVPVSLASTEPPSLDPSVPPDLIPILPFSMNPKGVKLEKGNKTESDRGVIATTLQDALRATGNIRLQLSEAFFLGAGFTTLAVEQLVRWATPRPMKASDALKANNAGAVTQAIQQAGQNYLKNAAGGNSSAGGWSSPSTKKATINPADAMLKMPLYYRLPVLRFMWGFGAPLNNELVNLEKVSVDYQRFDFSGTPVWAKVSLTLVQFSQPAPLTNPTSGGVTGRSKHVVSQGENVIQIANRVYGSPNAWRWVAEANGIDDPLRVKPGRTLMLPPPGEVLEATA
jgi:nucleoid-associated protein YgaU